MAVTNRTLQLLHQLRVDIGAETDDVVRALTSAWVGSWDALAEAWEAAVEQLADEVEANGGTWPPAWRLSRLRLLAVALLQTETALDTLAAQTQTAAAAGAAEVVALTAAAEPLIMASQLPAAAAAAAAEAYAAAVAPSALEAIGLRARQQITSTARPLSGAAMDAIRRQLVIGVAVGANPREVAPRILAATQGTFNGGLSRALNIARTEMLDAYRETSAAVHAANQDVLDGWTWIASLDRRCCPSCWAMHGTVHGIDQPGPWDHQQGRCSRLPKVKSWEELGITGVESEDLTPDATAVFGSLPLAAQLDVMGPARLALLTAGRVGLGDLAVRRENPSWRPSYVPRPVKDLQRLADRRRT